MNINTEWNEEPTGQPNYGQAISSGFNWLVNQGQGLMSQAAQMQTPEENVEDMIRQLRQERARQSY